jgi:hypothetical protein
MNACGKTILMLAMLAGASPGMAQDAAPDITGVWQGTFTGGIRSGGGQLAETTRPGTFVQAGDNIYTLTIAEQNGRGFTGTWGADVGSEPIQGVIRLDNRTILTVDSDSSQTGTLLSETELEFCNHTITESDRFTFCFLLEKQ